MIWHMLQIPILLIRSALAAILIASGAAKLSDVRGFAMTLVGLGFPAYKQHWLRGLAISIPLFEVGGRDRSSDQFWGYHR